MKIIAATMLVFFTLWTNNQSFAMQPASPLHLDNKTDDHVFIALKEAAEDFSAVVSGKPPVFAVLDKEAPLPTDGGTTYFKGRGYSLTILQSLVTVSGGACYLYGPIIKFDDSLMFGNSNTISRVEIYSPTALRELLGYIK